MLAWSGELKNSQTLFSKSRLYLVCVCPNGEKTFFWGNQEEEKDGEEKVVEGVLLFTRMVDNYVDYVDFEK